MEYETEGILSGFIAGSLGLEATKSPWDNNKFKEIKVLLNNWFYR